MDTPNTSIEKTSSTNTNPEGPSTISPPIDRIYGTAEAVLKEVLQTNSRTMNPYVTKENAQEWTSGIETIQVVRNNPIKQETIVSQNLIPSKGSPSNIGDPRAIIYEKIKHTPKHFHSGISSQMEIKEVFGQKVETAPSNYNIAKQFQNEDRPNIQNIHGFPIFVRGPGSLETHMNKTTEHMIDYEDTYPDGRSLEEEKMLRPRIAARYDYKINVGDPNLPLMTSLEDRLMEARASLGIPVHGNNDIAKNMKYFMYNRFKIPDRNLAHNKTFTYVFFTRPDLNIMVPKQNKANQQTQNHSEAAMLWRRNPLIFQLLTDAKRCAIPSALDNNFNLLLSNQCMSIDIKDENLTTVEAGKTWSGYEMQYGDQYSGRAAGEFSCNFLETSDYSIINLIKFWITYIDNVSRGVWSPSYNLFGDGLGYSTNINDSHVYTKTLDYASSAYVFKCGPDGEDIIYWTKYYGIFPTNTGASILSWDNGQNIGDSPRLNINFKYSFKSDLNPVALIEFNAASKPTDGKYESPFDPKYGHSSRPYVGCPFVEMYFGNQGGLFPNAQLRLKFKPTVSGGVSDPYMFRATLSKDQDRYVKDSNVYR